MEMMNFLENLLQARQMLPFGVAAVCGAAAVYFYFSHRPARKSARHDEFESKAGNEASSSTVDESVDDQRHETANPSTHSPPDPEPHSEETTENSSDRSEDTLVSNSRRRRVSFAEAHVEVEADDSGEASDEESLCEDEGDAVLTFVGAKTQSLPEGESAEDVKDSDSDSESESEC